MTELALSTARDLDEGAKSPVGYTLVEGIATLALDDGKVNALSIETLRALHEALDRAERDEAVVLLAGRPGYLSAGFDLQTFGAGIEAVLEMLTLGAGLMERLLSFPRPVVVACSGHAVAAGSFLALAADARIGAEGEFRIGLNEVKIGLTVPWFAIELARHRLAPAHFDAAVITARMYDPTTAMTAGFLDRVVPAKQLGESSKQAARELAELNADAHAATKLRARAGVLTRLREAIETELTPEGLGSASPPH
ncbi:MAG TPA: crotonase/enoyl-CoA hydratase family protein [Solirubrobacteraceae bacterium]|nr:crotonase/enoyl-CoA hydratase family protein [Solirubrobacteraceae bacterium]